MHTPLITLFGGSGFLGRYVVESLAEEGYNLRIAVRHPDAARHLKPAGRVGQISVMQTNIREETSVRRAIVGADIVINLVGVLHESGSQTFAALQAQGAERIAKIAADNGVSRLIHISALGVDKATKSRYARSKLNGEKAVMNAFKTATILRPGLIFGADDNFFNRFAHMASILPFVPVIGEGKTRFQPVYVKDVAQAVLACIQSRETAGKTYELGGPAIYSFDTMMEIMLKEIDSPSSLLHIPTTIARLMATLTEWLPNPPLTRDQITLLQYDNVVSDNALTFNNLGLIPSSAESILPHYLWRYRKGARFAHRHEAQ